MLDHSKIIDHLVACSIPGLNDYPCVSNTWDNTPRSGLRGTVFQGSSPKLFRRNLKQAFSQVSANKSDEQIVFIKAWNEWAEGNHLEPDLKFGHRWLEAIRDEKTLMAP